MFDSGLFIGWGEAYPGREEQALRVFSETETYWGKLVEDGRISSYEPFWIGPHGGGLRGFFIIRGTPEQIVALRADDEFMTLVTRAQLCVTELGIEDLYFGESLRQVMARFEHEVGAFA